MLDIAKRQAEIYKRVKERMTAQQSKFFVKNRKDFDELQEHLRDGLTIQIVGAYPDVASVAFQS